MQRRSQKNYVSVAKKLDTLITRIEEKEELLNSNSHPELRDTFLRSLDLKQRIVKSTMEATSKNLQEIFMLAGELIKFEERRRVEKKIENFTAQKIFDSDDYNT